MSTPMTMNHLIHDAVRRDLQRLDSALGVVAEGDEEGRTYLRATVPPPVTFILARVFGRRYRRTIAPVWRAAA